jgi:hypothetical protein
VKFFAEQAKQVVRFAQDDKRKKAGGSALPAAVL